MEYSNLYTSGLRVMAQSDHDSIKSRSSSKSLKNYLPRSLNMDFLNREESGSRGHGRITSLPSRLFRRTNKRLDDDASEPGSSRSLSLQFSTTRKGSLDTNPWPPHRSGFPSSDARWMNEDGLDHEDEESLWHARTLLKTRGHDVRSPPESPILPLTPKTPTSASASTRGLPRRPRSKTISVPPPPPIAEEDSDAATLSPGPTTPHDGGGTSFLWLSSPPPSACSSARTSTIGPPDLVVSRPSSVYKEGDVPPSLTSSNQWMSRAAPSTRDDISSVVYTEEVQDWRRFYVDMSNSSPI